MLVYVRPSNEHSFTVRSPPFSCVSFEGRLDGPSMRATFSPAHPLTRRDVPLAQARVF